MPRLTRLALAFTIVLLCLAIVGCFEKTQKVTLNPDGSGKTEVDFLIMPLAALNPSAKANGKPQLTPEEELKSTLGKLLTSSKGIDVWKDVTAEVAKDGRLHIRGVAYFKELSQVRFQMGAFSGDNRDSWSKDPQGGMVLVHKFNNRPVPPPASLTDAEIDAKIATSKTQWQQAKPSMTTLLAPYKEDSTYILPGKVSDPGAWEPVAGGGVRIVIDGKKVLDMMDKMMTDDAELRQIAKSGRDPMKDGPADEKISQLVLGRSGKPEAHVTGDLKPLFDYDAEVAAAKAATPKMLESLGVNAAAATPPMPAAK